jgi:hypothetical protein
LIQLVAGTGNAESVKALGGFFGRQDLVFKTSQILKSHFAKSQSNSHQVDSNCLLDFLFKLDSISAIKRIFEI